MKKWKKSVRFMRVERRLSFFIGQFWGHLDFCNVWRWRGREHGRVCLTRVIKTKTKTKTNTNTNTNTNNQAVCSFIYILRAHAEMLISINRTIIRPSCFLVSISNLKH